MSNVLLSKVDRRTFLKQAAVATGGISLGGLFVGVGDASAVPEPRFHRMRFCTSPRTATPPFGAVAVKWGKASAPHCRRPLPTNWRWTGLESLCCKQMATRNTVRRVPVARKVLM